MQNKIIGIILIIIGFSILLFDINITNNMLYAVICFATQIIITSKRD